MRVTVEKEEESWRTMHDRAPPPTKIWVIERVPQAVPVKAIPKLMKEALAWEVEQPRCKLRGKGEKATRRVTVKANEAPTIDTVEIFNAVCQIRELKPQEKEEESKADAKDFCQHFKEADGAKKY